MADTEYEVPTKDQLFAFAEKVVSDPDDILESEYYDYSEEINDVLLALRDGEDLDDGVRTELRDLYDEWEAENFPVAEADYDAVQEGGPKGETEEDPDLEPDPEDV
jgi:hypothetical protein